MIRRLIVALVALLIAAVGGVLTFLYAAGADARAMAEMSPTQVLVVAEPIAAGTPSEALARSLTVSEIPAAAVVPGGVNDLSEVAGLLTSADLQPGEQLLSARFIAPEALPDEVEIPEDMHLLTVQLETRRVIGGDVRPGDTVGIFASGTVNVEGDAAAAGVETIEGDQTQLILHKVLVTGVEGGTAVVTDENGQQTEQAAATSIMVTLALTQADAERVVFAAEFANIYLSLEGENVPEDGTRIVTAEELFQ